MKTVFLVLILMVQVAGAKMVMATYEVSYGIFENLGIAEAKFETREDNTYSIRIEARTVGVAKVLSDNRVEVYESHGIVRNGLLIPQKYIKTRRTDSKKMIKIYTFDHVKKTVVRENINSDEWEPKPHEYYASEDILTLFFNFKHYFHDTHDRPFYAVGGNKKDGRIDVVFLKGEALEEAKKKLDKSEGKFLKVVLNDKIFSSANGELLIHLDENGLCTKAILEDVMFFGDIVGNRIDTFGKE